MPHNAKMHYNYANLQRDLSRVDTAIAHYKEAIRSDSYRTLSFTLSNDVWLGVVGLLVHTVYFKESF